MANYLIALALVLVSIAQVAWANFLVIGGVIVPISVIGLWVVTYKSEFTNVAVYAFLSGLTIDILSADVFGLRSLALLLSVGGISLINNRFDKSNLLAKVMALVVGLVIYQLVVVSISLILK
ncbi:hypothetical protein KC614_01830 [candidate division WWE3 bacterium]|uniref:Rod shape-determining protein MreD n=1 Tax=candidate division WWE3 bacterium TaxID=2053526 RepID=A0A955LJT0_UNCKA|nr:hypothetical protein [candidate division WWE3 bacterium]